MYYGVQKKVVKYLHIVHNLDMYIFRNINYLTLFICTDLINKFSACKYYKLFTHYQHCKYANITVLPLNKGHPQDQICCPLIRCISQDPRQ